VSGIKDNRIDLARYCLYKEWFMDKKFVLFAVLAVQLGFSPEISARITKDDGSVQRHGSGTSGGGASWVCRDGVGKVTKAYLYDLYEGANDPTKNLTFIGSKETDPFKIARSALKKWKKSSPVSVIAPDVVDTISRALGLVERDRVNLKDKTKLPVKPDFTPTIVPSGGNCQFELSAFYDDSRIYNGHLGVLFIDPEIYNALTNVEQAALLVHEAVYKAMRILTGDTSSDETRKLVPAIFAVKDKAFAEYIANVEMPAPWLWSYFSDRIQSEDDKFMESYIKASEEEKQKKAAGLWTTDDEDVDSLPIRIAFDLNPTLMDLVLGGKSLICQTPNSTEKTIYKVAQVERRPAVGFCQKTSDGQCVLVGNDSAYERTSPNAHTVLQEPQFIFHEDGPDQTTMTIDSRDLLLKDAFEGKPIKAHYSFTGEFDGNDVDTDMTCVLE
jgi:hypothetical protein